MFVHTGYRSMYTGSYYQHVKQVITYWMFSSHTILLAMWLQYIGTYCKYMVVSVNVFQVTIKEI